MKVGVLIVGLMLTACTTSSATTSTTVAPTTTTATTTTKPAPSAASTTTMAGSIATDLLSRLAPPLDPTPAQAEGPYYPPIKPADTDNDLFELTGASGVPAGTELTIEGLLVDIAAIPIAGATIELWQTDAEGLYLHPDFDGEPLDQNFQYFGTAVTDEDGLWRFRTVEPLNYESRPKHLHIKVLDGEIALLTTQIYFSGDPLLDSDRVIGNVDLELLTATTESRGSGLYATHVLVIDG